MSLLMNLISRLSRFSGLSVPGLSAALGAAGLAVGLAAGLILGGLYLHEKGEHARLRTAHGELAATLNGREAALVALSEQIERDGRLAADNAQAAAAMRRQVRGLERSLQEAMRHDRTVDYDALISDAVALELCRLWHVAAGADAAVQPPTGADSRTVHPGAPHSPARPAGAYLRDGRTPEPTGGGRLCDGRTPEPTGFGRLCDGWTPEPTGRGRRLSDNKSDYYTNLIGYAPHAERADFGWWSDNQSDHSGKFNLAVNYLLLSDNQSDNTGNHPPLGTYRDVELLASEWLSDNLSDNPNNPASPEPERGWIAQTGIGQADVELLSDNQSYNHTPRSAWAQRGVGRLSYNQSDNTGNHPPLDTYQGVGKWSDCLSDNYTLHPARAQRDVETSAAEELSDNLSDHGDEFNSPMHYLLLSDNQSYNHSDYSDGSAPNIVALSAILPDRAGLSANPPDGLTLSANPPDNAALSLNPPDGLTLSARASGRGAVAGGTQGAAPLEQSSACGSCADPCQAWLDAKLSVRDLVDWIGLLLEHAGAERLDKAALRARNQLP